MAIITQHGYRKIFIGVGHHLADSKGYAYEHRIIAEKKLGRELKKGELIHHINGNRLDNIEDNLNVLNGNAYHFLYHRKNNGRRLPDELNLFIKCSCGCGKVLLKFDKYGRPRSFISGHNIPTKERPFCACGCGKKVRHIKSKFTFNHASKNYKAEMTSCLCGCGNIFRKYDAHGRMRKYSFGHARRPYAILG